MPQLDQVTFISQFFWLCFFFFGFYYLICKNFLPRMGRILKLRKKRMNFSTEGIVSLQQENEKVRSTVKALVENGLNKSSALLSSHLQRIESWLGSVISNTNKKQLQTSNELYIEWIGDNSIRQHIALLAAAPFSSEGSPRIFASILIEKCKNKKKQASFSQGTAKQAAFLSRPDSLDQIFTEKTKRGSAEQTNRSRASKK